MESRGGSVPVSSRPPRDTTTRRNATGGRLVGVSDGKSAIARCGVVELVVDEDRVVLASAGIHGLLESVAAGAVGIGSRIEDGGEGIFPAVVRAAGTGKAVGRCSDEADDSPRITPRCRGCQARLKAAVLDDRPGGAGISSNRENKAPESGKQQRKTHL